MNLWRNHLIPSSGFGRVVRKRSSAPIYPETMELIHMQTRRWYENEITRAVFLYSLDKIQLLQIMPSCISQLEFPVVSGQHTISKYRSLVHMSSYIDTFFMWNQISACFIFTSPKKLYPFLSAIYLDLVSYMMEPTGTGQVNVICPVGSTLSWSAEFKHRNISANAVHVCGDLQHLKGHWVKRERQSWCLRFIKELPSTQQWKCHLKLPSHLAEIIKYRKYH
jgi:hypothetical protein